MFEEDYIVRVDGHYVINSFNHICADNTDNTHDNSEWNISSSRNQDSVSSRWIHLFILHEFIRAIVLMRNQRDFQESQTREVALHVRTFLCMRPGSNSTHTSFLPAYAILKMKCNGHFTTKRRAWKANLQRLVAVFSSHPSESLQNTVSRSSLLKVFNDKTHFCGFRRH